jgi:hypothetical protein
VVNTTPKETRADDQHPHLFEVDQKLRDLDWCAAFLALKVNAQQARDGR